MNDGEAGNGKNSEMGGSGGVESSRVCICLPCLVTSNQFLFFIVVLFYSTLGNMYIREGFEKNPVLTDKGIKHIAQSYDASPAQVVLKWALESDVIIIPQSRNPNHIETNFHLHQIFLSDKDKEYFEQLDGKLGEEEGMSNSNF